MKSPEQTAAMPRVAIIGISIIALWAVCSTGTRRSSWWDNSIEGGGVSAFVDHQIRDGVDRPIIASVAARLFVAHLLREDAATQPWREDVASAVGLLANSQLLTKDSKSLIGDAIVGLELSMPEAARPGKEAIFQLELLYRGWAQPFVMISVEVSPDGRVWHSPDVQPFLSDWDGNKNWMYSVTLAESSNIHYRIVIHAELVDDGYIVINKYVDGVIGPGDIVRR